MALWVVRAGEKGEQENGALTNNVVTIGWNEFGDLSGYGDFDSLYDYYKSIHTKEKHDKPTDYEKSIRLLCGEVWAFLRKIKIGDYVVLPSKKTDNIFIGKILGSYEFETYAENIKHVRKVQWLKTIKRSELPPFILSSFNTGLVVFEVKENDAETVIQKMISSENKSDKFEEGEILVKEFLEKEYGEPFVNFQHKALVDEEDYKLKIYQSARKELNLSNWSEGIKTPGQILDAVKKATEVDPKNNNLLDITGKRGPQNNSNACLYQIKDITGFEKVLYDFFLGGPSNPKSLGPRFDNLSKFISENKGKSNWRFLSYLLFLFNSDLYFPISPQKFDKALIFYEIPQKLSYEEKTWEKYALILDLVQEVGSKLSKKYGPVSNLQVQSYLWELVRALESKSERKRALYVTNNYPLMSQFSEISQTKEVSDGKLRIPTKSEVKAGIREIQKELLIDDSIIEEIVTHLASGRHVLLAGPVGTGKTRISQLISEVFWTESCGYFADVRTATADWNTQDVIGGISPKIQDGSIIPTYEIENGCVTDTILANFEKNSRLTEKPQRHTSIHNVNNKQKQFNGTWLVIDEFNRADIDKAFGQLFTALEYNKLIIQDITSGKSTRTIPIPKDYRIIGTLNTADKHYLFNLSDALKRRFAYVEISIPQRNEKNKQREIYLAIKNGLKDLDSDKFTDIIKINPENDTMTYYSNKVQKNIEYGYNVLEVIREFKPLGTAILKAIYQTLLVSEKMENNDSFDNAINANLTPQLETLPKPSLEILHAYLFGNVVEFLKKENHMEQYKTGLESLLRYLNFSSDEIKTNINEFVNGQISNTLSDKIEQMKKSNPILFPERSLFKKSLAEIIKQSEF